MPLREYLQSSIDPAFVPLYPQDHLTRDYVSDRIFTDPSIIGCIEEHATVAHEAIGVPGKDLILIHSSCQNGILGPIEQVGVLGCCLDRIIIGASCANGDGNGVRGSSSCAHYCYLYGTFISGSGIYA